MQRHYSPYSRRCSQSHLNNVVLTPECAVKLILSHVVIRITRTTILHNIYSNDASNSSKHFPSSCLTAGLSNTRIWCIYNKCLFTLLRIILYVITYKCNSHQPTNITTIHSKSGFWPSEANRQTAAESRKLHSEEDIYWRTGCSAYLAEIEMNECCNFEADWAVLCIWHNVECALGSSVIVDCDFWFFVMEWSRLMYMDCDYWTGFAECFSWMVVCYSQYHFIAKMIVSCAESNDVPRSIAECCIIKKIYKKKEIF